MPYIELWERCKGWGDALEFLLVENLEADDL